MRWQHIIDKLLFDIFLQPANAPDTSWIKYGSSTGSDANGICELIYGHLDFRSYSNDKVASGEATVNRSCVRSEGSVSILTWNNHIKGEMSQTKQSAPFCWKFLVRITTRQSVCCCSEKNAAPATMLFGFGSCHMKNTHEMNLRKILERLYLS